MIVFDYTTTLVIVGTTILGITAGFLGVFATLRGHSLLGDAISHAAFPGIVGAFLLTYSKQPWILMMGGACTGCIGALCIALILRSSTLKKDTALGIVLSVFFGIGLVLMTILQKKPVASQAILNKFLFGNASTLLMEDIHMMMVVAAIVLLVLVLLKKEFTLLIFDASYAHVVGYPIFILDITLVLLLVCAIMVGLQTVGVILMSTMIIAPAIAARQWSYNISTMLYLAALFGASSTITGSIVSSWYNLPTGPVIVVLLTFAVFGSLVCAPWIGIGNDV